MVRLLQKLTRRRTPPQAVRRRAFDRDTLEPRTAARSGGDYVFRRNRTLTGSLLSGVASPSEHRADLKSPRVQTHELRHHRRRLTLSLGLVVVVISVLSWILYQAIVTPRVELVGAQMSSDTAQYANAIQNYLNEHPFERLRATVNTRTLTTYLQQHDLPEVQQIDPKVSLSGFGGASFSVVLRQPVVSWRSSEALVYVDADGVAFSRNMYNLPVVEVVDKTGVQASVDQILVSNRFLEFVGKAVGYFTARDYTVVGVVLPEDTTRQLQIVLDGVKYPIKLSVDRPAAGQVEDAVRAIRYFAARSITPEYLDVRVSGRAFYK